MVRGQAHLEDIVPCSESLQHILVVNQLTLESLVSSFYGNLLAPPSGLEGLVVPSEQLILSLCDLLRDSFSGLPVIL
jgi:hypothetical protein